MNRYRYNSWLQVAYEAFFVCIILFSFPSFGQIQYDTVSRFNLPVQMDSFVVHSGFDVKAFIKRMRSDTTFFKAFKNMRFTDYDAINDIRVLDNDGQTTASLFSNTHQIYINKCRRTIIAEEKTTGNFYKGSKEYRYYTAELYAHLFFTETPVCNESDIVATSIDSRGKGKIERSKAELKQLMFNPGAPVKGVPFMSDRTSIFDEDEAVKYNFKISREVYEGQDCFMFRITPKKGYEHKVLYDEFTTWFRLNDYSIIARDYSLSYSTLIYDFNVRIKVRTTTINNKLYPIKIDYDGNWHIFTKKRERVRFSMTVRY